MGEVHRLVPSETVFGLQAAGRLMNKIFAPWVQDLSLLAESVEAVRPPGALPDWQPGAVVPRWIVTDSRKMLLSPISTPVRSPLYFWCCGASPRTA